MSRHRILSVGQCGFDHGQISRTLSRSLDAEVVRSDTHAEALETLRDSGPFALVLVNRIGDADGSRGLDLIRRLKAETDMSSVPVMLVSNYDDAQIAAVEAGALRGFGKNDLGTGKELVALRQVFPERA
jgi:two-component system chemotaxis response regulator CheY